MGLILPGVEIKVVKEIVVGQLNPGGVLGVVGFVEDQSEYKAARASSYKALRERFGPSVDATLPTAKAAFVNGISEVVVTPIESRSAAKASLELRTGEKLLRFTARARGAWGNRLRASFQERAAQPGTFRLVVSLGAATEVYDGLTLSPDDERNLAKVVNLQSDYATLEVADSRKKDDKGAPASEMVEGVFAGGRGASPKDYERALERLESEEDVDLIAAEVEEWSKPEEANEIFKLLEAHCKRMSDLCANRIAVGSAPPSDLFRTADEEVEAVLKQRASMSSDRFIYCAPHGTAGAVAGLIGSIQPHVSPTYKEVGGLKSLSRNYSTSQLKSLLQANVLVLEEKRGRGIIVEKGICTSGEQISVQRTADRAVRGVKKISDAFIGTLNNSSGRAALKEKITEFFIQLEREGAIVPSSDLKDPSHKVEVYASDDDIAKGIVRVDVAVRPVRAIDYIYGTILVRA
jgi:hypothetical protein